MTQRAMRLRARLQHGCAAALIGWAGCAAAQAGIGAQGAASAGAAAPPAAAQAAAAPSASAGARFLEACNLALQRGVTDLGCQGPLYRNELDRLKREALTTQNPQLLSLVGDAYGSRRSGVGDAGQAYRWYLLAAVRGDPRAMQRLAEMNQRGIGTPQDKVKALGYARLVQRLGVPGATEAGQDVAQTIEALGSEMAAEEVALAERFAAELQAQVTQAASATPSQGTGSGAGPAAPAFGASPGATVPGMPHAHRPDEHTAPLPGSRLPGTPSPP